MKKSLIAVALILCTSQFALAQEEFYLIRDNTTKVCRVVNGSELATTQKVRYAQLGKYATMDEAKAALDNLIGTKQCPKM